METKRAPSVVSISRSLGYYQWGKSCEAWNFVDNKELSVKLEKMPGGTEEVLHYHNQSQQFFYILEGKAVFEVDEVILIVHKGEGLHIEAGRKHQIMNKEEESLMFLVCSQPTTSADRHNLV
jgi:mannose-6-phosphate isomerase-like protein (cupin superfamily)